MPAPKSTSEGQDGGTGGEADVEADGRGPMSRKLAPFRAAEVPRESDPRPLPGGPDPDPRPTRPGDGRAARSTGPIHSLEVPVSHDPRPRRRRRRHPLRPARRGRLRRLRGPVHARVAGGPGRRRDATCVTTRRRPPSGSASGWRPPGWWRWCSSPPGWPARIRAARPASWVPSVVVGLAVAGMRRQAGVVRAGTRRPARRPVRRRHAHRTARHQRRAVRPGWALDGAFALLLGLGALATAPCHAGSRRSACRRRELPCWSAIAVPALFDTLQLVFLVWLLATSGWLLVRGEPGGDPNPVRRQPEPASYA